MTLDMHDYKVMVVLRDGKRKRAHYDPRFPATLTIGGLNLRVDNPLLEGAKVICGNQEVLDLMIANGFRGTKPNADSETVSFRIQNELIARVREIAEENGSAPGTMVNVAIRYWIDRGAPIPEAKAKKQP